MIDVIIRRTLFGERQLVEFLGGVAEGKSDGAVSGHRRRSTSELKSGRSERSRTERTKRKERARRENSSSHP